MKNLWLAIVLMITAFGAVAAEGINPAGTYSLTGTDPDGTAYKGVVTVTKQGDHFLLSFKEEGAAGEYSGVGLVSDNEFAVAAVAEKKNSISILTPAKEGGFTAVWAWQGTKGLGKETWVPKK